MSISKVLEIYLRCIPNENTPPLLLVGGVGIGKTSQILFFSQKLAEKLNKRFVDVSSLDYQQILDLLNGEADIFPFLNISASLVNLDFVEGVVERKTDHYVMLPNIVFQLFKKYVGLIFLDELTNSPKSTFNALLKLILEKIAGMVKIHPATIFISACNDQESSSLAQPLPAPVLDRFLVAKVEPDLDTWIEFTENVGGDSRVIEWVKRNREILTFKPSDEEIEQFVSLSPRRLTQLAQLVKSKSIDEIKIIASWLLPSKYQGDFLSFVSQYLPDIESLTIDNFARLNHEQKTEVMVKLGKYFNEKLQQRDTKNLAYFDNLLTFLIENQGEYVAVFLKAMLHKNTPLLSIIAEVTNNPKNEDEKILSSIFKKLNEFSRKIKSEVK